MIRHVSIAMLAALVVLSPAACRKNESPGKATLLRYARDMNAGELVKPGDVTGMEIDEDALPGLGDPVPYEHLPSLAARPLCVPVSKNQWVLQRHFTQDNGSIDAQIKKYLPASRPAATTSYTNRP